MAANLVFTPSKWYVGEDEGGVMHVILEGRDPAGTPGTVVVRMHSKDMETFATSVLERVRVAMAEHRIILTRDPALNVAKSGAA